MDQATMTKELSISGSIDKGDERGKEDNTADEIVEIPGEGGNTDIMIIGENDTTPKQEEEGSQAELNLPKAQPG